MSKKVLIFGSCVSRDIFEFDENKDFEIVRYYARSSFAALMGLPFVEKDVLDKIPSPFQRRCALWDMQKNFWDFLEQGEFDVLLLDFIDDRFNIYKCANNALSTISVAYSEATKGKLNSNNVIKSTSIDFINLWQKGLKKFTQRVQKFANKIILNEVFHSNMIEGGGGGTSIEPSINKDYLYKINAYLQARYKDFEQALPNAKILRYPNELFKIDINHKWGIASIHYQVRLYDFALENIKMMS